VKKPFFIKNKKVLWTILGVVFIIFILLIKTKSVFKNETAEESGLVYSSSATLADLSNKDTDGDGVVDWEESLWGTDPTKVDTDEDGIPDGAEIAKEKAANGQGGEVLAEENLTETDKFSRELFTTVAILNQGGAVMDQAVIDELSSSLAEQVQNSSAKKVFSISDVKTADGNTLEVIQAYDTTLTSILKKNPIIFKNGYKGIAPSVGLTFADVFQKFLASEDINVLLKLDPLIKELDGIVAEMAKMTVPQVFLILHLETINGFERVVENMKDLKLIESDTIVAMKGASKLKENMQLLEGAISKLGNTLIQKLQ
jgi:hypothetical protein